MYKLHCSSGMHVRIRVVSMLCGCSSVGNRESRHCTCSSGCLSYPSIGKAAKKTLQALLGWTSSKLWLTKANSDGKQMIDALP